MDRGCGWEGTVGTLKKHLTTCKFALIPCPKECKGEDAKAIRQLMRKDVKIHLKNDCPNRDDECEYCGMKGTHAKIKVHDEICKKKILPCSNVECKKKIRRSYMDKHVNNHCEYTMVPCKYESIGCSKRMIRRDIKEHEEDDDKAHLHMALDVLKDKVIPVLMKEEIQVMPVLTNDTLVPVLKQGTPMTFKLANFTSKKDEHAIFYSPFYSNPGGYHLVIRVDANGIGDGGGTHVSVFCLAKKGRYDEELKWPFNGKITFTLLNQIQNDKHHAHIVSVEPPHDKYMWPGGTGWGKPQFILHSKLTHDPEKGTQYLKDDTLYFKVLVELAEHKPWLECTTCS